MGDAAHGNALVMSHLMQAPESGPSSLRQASEFATATADRVVTEVRHHTSELAILGGTLAFVFLVGLVSLVALAG